MGDLYDSYLAALQTAADHKARCLKAATAEPCRKCSQLDLRVRYLEARRDTREPHRAPSPTTDEQAAAS